VIQPRALNLSDVVNGVEQLLLRTLGEHVELITGLAGRLSPVLADPGQIEQVLINLAVNARDAMPQGGKLTIQTAMAGVGEPAATQLGLLPARYVTLKVSDTGTGIPDRVCEPFFSTKPKGEGSGLGWPPCTASSPRQTAASSWTAPRGTAARSRSTCPPPPRQRGAPPNWTEERGSEERATRATKEGGGSKAPAEAQRSRAGGKQRETILIVDDEPSVLAVTSRILRQHGYPTMEAGTGDEALILAATRDFQRLLTDSVMPGMNGPTLAERVAALRPGLPIIRMSGSDDTARARPHLTPGSAQAYIQKPFAASDLIGKVRAARAAAAAHPPGPAG
jgi:CheY-like chemotaxis protein